jgi:hypothetical protein
MFLAPESVIDVTSTDNRSVEVRLQISVLMPIGDPWLEQIIVSGHAQANFDILNSASRARTQDFSGRACSRVIMRARFG